MLAAMLAGTAPASAASEAPAAQARVLAVCSDPSNLPYSDAKLGGFENRIAALLAAELDAGLHYAWSPQRRSFLRNTLNARECDVVVGVPQGLPGVLQTRPYYASSYVFVTRRDRKLRLEGFDDAALARLRIGLPAVGIEGVNTPAAMALARRGIVERVQGYSVWDRSIDETPQARIVADVARGAIDVAILWGPTAGYFARHHGDALELTPIDADPRQPELAFSYSMTLGVRRGEDALRDDLQQVLDRRRTEIDAILREYGVPVRGINESTNPENQHAIRP